MVTGATTRAERKELTRARLLEAAARIRRGLRERDLPVRALTVSDALVQYQFSRRLAHQVQVARTGEGGARVPDGAGVGAGRESHADVVGGVRTLRHPARPRSGERDRRHRAVASRQRGRGRVG